ncbi:MAG: helix-turn-helix transcriptional regulator [Alphaproteobacteria bacterium]|nr:helix-turn-helix transcriptional regulator [Alphaproteobacteria bacterium]
MYTLDQIKNKDIGLIGTELRDKFEYELRMDIISELFKKARLERHLTQEELGKLIGVQKSQISKLENNANSATIDTIVYLIFWQNYTFFQCNPIFLKNPSKFHKILAPKYNFFN